MHSLALHPSAAEGFARALAEAWRFAGATAPNPAVGCALLDAEGTVLAVAAHQRAGAEHAEALAIRLCREAGTAESIHTVLATLEPCDHTGRQPPCSRAILATPARAVWIGCPDPHPEAAGGAQRLRQAGLEVRLLSQAPGEAAAALRRQCERLAGPFFKRLGGGGPWVTVKQAFDPAGSMIPPPGRKTFTSPASLTLAHALRRRANAILTGSGTILADAPEFTVRHLPDHAGARRWLVILDRRGRIPEDYLAGARARGFRVRVERDLGEALAFLAAQADVLEVLVEAGPQVSEAVLSAGLWDERVVIRALGEGEVDDVEVIAAARP